MPLTSRKPRRKDALIAFAVLGVAGTVAFGARSHKARAHYREAASTEAIADVEQIKTAIFRYAHSMDLADTTLASQIWSNSPDVSFIHPLGQEHGFEQIKENVYMKLMGGLFSERKLSAHDISAHVYGDAAWAEFYWDFAAKLRKDGSPIETHGRETQIYHKENGAWRLVHVHYSEMPRIRE
jgi:ketosteroid isomerase-like protein